MVYDPVSITGLPIPPLIMAEGLEHGRALTDFLTATRLTPQELEVMRLIAERPMTVEHLREELGVSRNRIWQIIGRLERSHVRLSS